jgi:hypothetical protein
LDKEAVKLIISLVVFAVILLGLALLFPHQGNEVINWIVNRAKGH